MRHVRALSVVVLCVFLVACASSMVKPLEVSKVTAETALYEARLLQNKGVITEAEFLQLKTVYDKLKIAQDVAIDTRIAYLMLSSTENEAKMLNARKVVTQLSAQFVSMAEKLGIGGTSW